MSAVITECGACLAVHFHGQPAGNVRPNYPNHQVLTSYAVVIHGEPCSDQRKVSVPLTCTSREYHRPTNAHVDSHRW